MTTSEDDGPQVRVVGITDKVRPEDPVVCSAPTGADLVAAGNEYAQFQVIAWAAGDPLPGLTVSANDLVGPNATIPAARIGVARIDYYESTQPTVDQPVGRWPDPLVPTVFPVNGAPVDWAFPIDIPAGENRGAWIEILVPAGTPADVYTGSISVVADGLDVTVPVTLEVLAFTLPATASLSSGFGANLDALNTTLSTGNQPLGTQRLAAVLCLNNRVSIASQWRLTHVGEIPFEQQIVPLIDGTDIEVQLRGAKLTSVWPRHDPDPSEFQLWHRTSSRHVFQQRSAVYDAPECDELEYGEAHLGKSWTTCRDDFVTDALNRLPEAAILLTSRLEYLQQKEADDPPGPITVVDGHPGRILLACLVNEMDPTGGASERATYDADFLAVAPGNRLWLYTSSNSNQAPGCIGYQIDAGGAHVRAIAWYCFTQRVSGELYYDVAAQFGPGAWTPGGLWNNGMNGDGTLLYLGTSNPQHTGTGIPLESIRLKLARAGYQDYEYLRFVAASSPENGAEVQQLADTLIPSPYAADQLTDADFTAARSRLVELLRPLLPATAPQQSLTL